MMWPLYFYFLFWILNYVLIILSSHFNIPWAMSGSRCYGIFWAFLVFCFLQMGNKGAFIRFESPDLKPNIVTFSAVVSNFSLDKYFWTLYLFIYFLGCKRGVGMAAWLGLREVMVEDCCVLRFLTYDYAWVDFSTFLSICSHTLMSSLWHMQTTSSECSHNLCAGTANPVLYLPYNGSIAEVHVISQGSWRGAGTCWQFQLFPCDILLSDAFSPLACHL